MRKKIQAYIHQHSLFAANDKIIVGVSGGADSCALLHLLLSLNYNCVIAHCNFHLRGDESGRDELFVTELARQYNCPLHNIHFNTTQFAAENNISIEMAARELRYEWFEKIRQEENAACIAVAHHSDDVVETVLMNLTRGTGINGLTGIKPKNGTIVRPLLCVLREDILQYIKQNRLSFVTDSTNNDTSFVRNNFRNIIIPALEKINPSFSANLLQTANRLNDAAHIYNIYIHNVKQNIVTAENDYIYISISKLKAEKIIRSILFEILKEYNFNASQCDNIVDNLDNTSGKIFLSSSHRLVKDREFLIINSINTTVDEETKIDFNQTKITHPVNLTIEIIEKKDDTIIENNPAIACLDADKISFPLTLRHWKNGDVFYPLGMKGKKKVSDFFTDKKYTLTQKEKAWLLLSDGKILWIINERIDDRFKITPKTKFILKISYYSRF